VAWHHFFTMDRFADFSLADLYAALDAHWRERGLTWQEAMHEINRRRRGNHPIAVSTVSGLRTKRVAEGDGVLQMLRWLERSPEHFVPGFAASDSHKLPDIPTHYVLRFDTRKLYAALEAQRVAGATTWRQVAWDIGGPLIGQRSLPNLKKGGRTAFPVVVRIARWLGQPTASFTHATPN
jgi:hypothetical protein